VDLLVVDPAHDADRVSEALLEEALRSASNKGCTVVEAAQPGDLADLARWERLGFRPAGPLLRRSVAAVGAAARRS
jgi:predicted N-acetyltransferase YhbS